MKLFNKDLRKQLTEVFDKMERPITLAVFTKEGECFTCEETKAYMSEIEALSDKINLEFYDLEKDAEKAKLYNVEMVPSTVFLNSEVEYEGVKFYGIPAGHEINSFVAAVMEVSGISQDLPEAIMKRVDAIQSPVNIKVFVTLGCPHCSGAVENAHKLALLNPHIESVMIEAETFGEISDRFNVSSVPKIVINNKYELIGNQPLEAFLNEIEKTQKNK